MSICNSITVARWPTLAMLIALASHAAAQPTIAERLAALEARVAMQEADLAHSRAEIAELRRLLSITDLAAEEVEVDGVEPRADAIAPQAPIAEDPDRIAIETRRKGLVSMRLGGQLEVEYVDTQNERRSPAGDTAAPHGRFQVDKLTLYMDARVAEGLHGVAKIDFTGDGDVAVDDLFIEADELPLSGRLSIGKRRRFIEMDRRIESYPLLAAAFWQKREIGVRGRFELAPFTLHASLTNGLPLGDGSIQEDIGFPTVLDRNANLDLDDEKEVGIGLEVDLDLKAAGELEAMAFAYFGRLSDEDLEYLASVQTPGRSADRDRSMWGISLDHDLGNFEVQAQLASADEGADLDRLAWYVQPSLAIDLDGYEAFGVRWLTGMRPLFRAGSLRTDLEGRADDSRTWNRSAYTAGLIVELARNAELIIEHSLHRESPHRFAIDNDEFIINLRLQW